MFKTTPEGRRYLLVEASGSRDRWVFPKGRVEKGETAAETAQREVAEEAGARARPIRRLRRVEQKQQGKAISIAYFLMVYSGRTKPLDKRRIRWLGFGEAVEALDLEKSRRVLRSADRIVSGQHRFRRAAARLARWLVREARALVPRRQSRGSRRSSRPRRRSGQSRK